MKGTSRLMATAVLSVLAMSNPNAAMSKDGVSQERVADHQPKPNKFWWPDELDLSQLRDHDDRSNPYGEDFNYAEAFQKLNLDSVKQDIKSVLTDSQDWWPADFGHYGPFFIRMAWHSTGTYRTLDGRGGGEGGQQRFNPLNSWPDNVSLDKARRLLWPIKQKYGANLSWGDLMVLAGTVAMEDMGFKTYGFAGGRTDEWEPDLVYWGPELEMMASNRQTKDGDLEQPLAATVMGLIYVNPEGPGGKPDPLASAKNIRTAFGRMAMNDEETVALIAGGHTFGKMHGAHKPKDCLDADPGAAGVEMQGLGWKNNCGKGHSEDTITSGLEGAWTQAPTKWTSLYLQNLLNNDWEKTKSPAGGKQWQPEDKALHTSVPDAHVKGKYHAPVMTTADLALKFDPEYRKIAEKFLNDPEAFRLAFAKAWYKLTHRDMGPQSRYLADSAPQEDLIWKDPLPQAETKAISQRQVEKLKAQILESGLTPSELVKTAWASASSFRASDMRGGANGARLLLAPQNTWAVNDPAAIKPVIEKLSAIQADFNEGTLFNKRQVSMADLIVIAGAAGIEKAAEDAGFDIEVPVIPGRVDATQDMTDVESFNALEPRADAFRNYYGKTSYKSPAEMMVDKADLLDLTVPEMTVLLGGMRVLDTNTQNGQAGVFTDKPGQLTNDFFVNLLDMSTKWQKAEDGLYKGLDRKTGEVKYTATPVDLVFGSNSELRAIAEVYAFDDSKQKFVDDFVKAWVKVMQLDRFDLHHDL
tara:strand:- start:14461 stop:16719 length:2259 start_codon:yes stop_codon:yes gene_type:complete